ncbi:NAD(P)-binding protein [Massarina eburnea CBS 473.64]|uniref:NAD(P)-binding protein n=1 Tax=Massarina eburnea CBS 473.64 TaxID=1395130 RepID=A0A6A6RUN0_9PLEO|nr:NAD(P)-binding protein [Massarina eburnea CBS 473.64]
MSKQLLVVFGATGNQGGSVIRYVLNDPDLSSRYSIRAITRNSGSPEAQALASKGVEVVSADLDNTSTLPRALKGAAFIFATTITDYQGRTREIETRQAKALCTEALNQGAKYIIWSSMSHPSKISGGKLTQVTHFDVKAEIEEYIRTLPIKSSFYAPGSFMQNYYHIMKPRPSPANDGTYVLANISHPTQTQMPLIDITDTGAWIGAILADPDKWEGKHISAAQGLYNHEQVVDIMSKVSGKTVTFKQLPDDVLKSALPAGAREMLYEMNVHFRDYGYYGPEQKELVEEGIKMARGQLTDLETFLRKSGFKLE